MGKKKSLLLILVLTLTIAISSSALAGGYGAFLFIRWVEYQPNGSVKNVVLTDESIMPGMKADVIYPDGTKHESKYNSIYDQQLCNKNVKRTTEKCYIKHSILADDLQPVDALKAGVYKLSPDFAVPAGYEFDDSVASKNDLKVTITQKDIADYKKLAEHGAGNLQWVITIPVKKQGSKPYNIEEEIIKPSQDFVYFGKKTTVRVSSSSNSNLKVVGQNTLAKKSKYVKIKSGKNARLVFTKKAPKGRYKFKIKGNKTTKTITIRVR